MMARPFVRCWRCARRRQRCPAGAAPSGGMRRRREPMFVSTGRAFAASYCERAMSPTSRTRSSMPAARQSVRARYGLRVEVTAPTPVLPATADSSTYVLVDRAQGGEVWRREIRTPGAGRVRSRLTEADWRHWQAARSHRRRYDVDPMNFFRFASDSAAESARHQGVHGDQARGIRANERGAPHGPITRPPTRMCPSS